MGKFKHEEDVFWGHDGTYIDVEATQDLRDLRDRPPLPNNPPPGPKWQAKQGMLRLPLNGAEYAVLACLIDRASKSKGACYPSQEFISRWTFRTLRTVRRAIKELSDKGVIRILYRGTTSNAYLINWPILFSAYRQMKKVEQRNTEAHAQRSEDSLREGNADQKWPGDDTKSGQETIQKVAAKPMKVEPRNLEPMTLSASSDDEAYLVVLDGGKEEAFRKEEVESASTDSERLEALRLEANERVVHCCTHFHWDNLTQEQFDSAVAAEMEVVGSGRAVLDAAANLNWQAKRKGQDQ